LDFSIFRRTASPTLEEERGLRIREYSDFPLPLRLAEHAIHGFWSLQTVFSLKTFLRPETYDFRRS
jgi:hypothetical protein